MASFGIHLLCFRRFRTDNCNLFYHAFQVRSDVSDAVPAGGHQGYAALGGLYTQCRPLVPHLYGSVEEQSLQNVVRC